MAGQSNSDYEAYYVPEKSYLAIFASLTLFTCLFGAANVLNDKTFGDPSLETNSWFIFLTGLVLFLATLFVWFRTTIIENRAGMNSAQLKHSYAIGMQWFIFSEVMFFAAFFGALWYVRNLAGPWLGGEGDGGRMNSLLWGSFTYEWPMMTTPQDAVGGAANQLIANNGVMTGPERNLSFPGWSNISHWLPMWNTIVLITSSFTAHFAHTGLLANNRKKFNVWLFITVALGIIFVGLQYMEYHEAYVEYGLYLNSGIYGSTFFMLTGFHGFHVCMGMIMLLVQWLRSTKAGHFTAEDHFGFEASSWYWHFVDVVWVGLFLFVYIL
ncbi:cytochrome c oxidase subunit 3 [Oceanicoccus sp. KOV_DT_Chl]|uniref:cytochrome c oxidase subunit 3 n=1 Tax=Oceanicoccus sp. KOV_DT_Chl TaxID=1904639 RepID=UPI000C7E73BF|nr:cytochrome c oxidase subunit 3 [Oceanicoccus sp. KOV_DT_Chl]